VTLHKGNRAVITGMNLPPPTSGKDEEQWRQPHF